MKTSSIKSPSKVPIQRSQTMISGNSI